MKTNGQSCLQLLGNSDPGKIGGLHDGPLPERGDWAEPGGQVGAAHGASFAHAVAALGDTEAAGVPTELGQGVWQVHALADGAEA